MKKIKISRWLVAATAAAGVIAGVTAVTTSAAAANGSTPAKPTIVLVHGAWADGSSWSGEVSLLQSKGYTVNVAPNPLRGVDSIAPVGPTGAYGTADREPGRTGI